MAKDPKDLSDEELISEFRHCCEKAGRGRGYSGGRTPESLRASEQADEVAKVLLERLRLRHKERADAKEFAKMSVPLPLPYGI